ncbi:hypothetical protein KY305_13550 [Bacillus sp. YC2]|uniref:hypothetical protein n=1 Tax=Bacillus sp. YC2 TaxID=2861287 RepID=UPI001CA692E5|nr:hypothetical protein [Bacillus sp. YC2]MBY8913764.1 hypothetical protein [Bacillus sp. YC2]
MRGRNGRGDADEACKEAAFSAAYCQYIEFLTIPQLYQPAPVLDELCRGIAITLPDEIAILGKMAVRGVPLLFFLNQDKRFTFTEMLTVKMFFLDSKR